MASFPRPPQTSAGLRGRRLAWHRGRCSRTLQACRIASPCGGCACRGICLRCRTSSGGQCLCRAGSLRRAEPAILGSGMLCLVESSLPGAAGWKSAAPIIRYRQALFAVACGVCGGVYFASEDLRIVLRCPFMLYHDRVVIQVQSSYRNDYNLGFLPPVHA